MTLALRRRPNLKDKLVKNEDIITTLITTAVDFQEFQQNNSSKQKNTTTTMSINVNSEQYPYKLARNYMA